LKEKFLEECRGKLKYSELSIFRFWRDRPKQTKNVRQRKIQNTTFF
jgi:hypothetical protein